MKLDVRYANHPEDSKRYTTEELRKHYFIGTIFEADEAALTYSHVDRIIAGGIMPVTKEVRLEGSKELGSEYFLERRELGVINIYMGERLMACISAKSKYPETRLFSIFSSFSLR